MSTHTPGPWKAVIYGGWDAPRIWSDSGSIALLQHHESGPSEAEANARLIASALMMLAALEQALPIIDAYRRISGGDGDIAAMNARAAIAQAKGATI